MATNSSNTTVDVEVGWQAAPRTRGTADILWTCVTVIILITWTNFYSSVEISKRRRAFTTFMAILVPELPALVALRDFWFAYRLHHCLHHLVERPGWKYGWTLRKSFLVVKGGMIAGNARRCVFHTASRTCRIKTWKEMLIDTETFLQLAVMGSIRYEEFPTTEEIKDKSKADWFSNGATCIQLIWFIGNLICRSYTGFAVSMLESMTLDWVMFGVMATMFWWECPQNINIPFTIPVHNPPITAPSPNRDPKAPVGTLLDYIALYKVKSSPLGEVNEDGDDYGVPSERNSLWSPSVGIVCLALPIVLHLTLQIYWFNYYQWHSELYHTLWRLFFGFHTVAEVALFYLDPHMRHWSSRHIYFEYVRPLMLEARRDYESDETSVSRWLTLAKGMGIYNSTDPKPWLRATQKTWHDIDLKLLVVTVFVILICQSGKLVIALMAFQHAPKGIYSVPDVQFLQAFVHVGG